MYTGLDSGSWKRGLIFWVVVMCCQSTVDAGVPVRVWGDLSGVYRSRDFNAAKDNSTDWLSISTINASSYIWRPWFALIDGGVSMTTDNRENSNNEKVDNKYASGKIRFNLFPGSRFPLLLYAVKSNNDRYDKTLSRTIVDTSVGMRQQYTSMDGKQFYSGNVEHKKREDIDQESFTNDVVDFKARYRMKDNAFYGNVDYSGIEKPNRDDATNYAITARHSYARKSNFTLENMLSTSQTHADYITNSNDTTSNQMSSFLSWRPGAKSDLNVTGSMRVSELAQTYQQYNDTLVIDEAKKNENSSININQGLIYNYTPQIIFTETLNGLIRKVDGIDQYTGSESVGTSYNSSAIKISSGFYNWFTGVNLSRQHGDDVLPEKFVKSQLGHSLSKNFMLTQKVKLQASFNQSASYNYRSVQENTNYLNHSITVNWAESSFKNNSSVRFLFSDIRSQDIKKNVYQLLNMQFFQDYRVSRHAHVTADLTLQYSQVTTDRDTTVTQYKNGQMNYINSRFFDVRGLLYKSEIRLSNKAENDKDVTQGNYSSFRDNLWKNEIIYRIGLFESRMSLDYLKNGGKYDRVIKIQLTRSFGDI